LVAGTYHKFTNGASATLDVAWVSLSYYDLGTAPVSVSVADIGSLSAAYSTNHAIGPNISFRWERLNGAR
jgi:hypothetical protein